MLSIVLGHNIFYSYKRYYKLHGGAGHAFNPSIWEAYTSDLGVPCQPGLQSKFKDSLFYTGKRVSGEKNEKRNEKVL